MNGILDTDIKFLHGVGPKRAEMLAKEVGIRTFGDMLNFFPFRYVDRSIIYPIKELLPTMAYIQVRGKVIEIKHIGSNPRNLRLSIIIYDGTGTLELLFFKGIKWIEQKIKAGKEGNGAKRQIAKLMLNSLYGKFGLGSSGFS